MHEEKLGSASAELMEEFGNQPAETMEPEAGHMNGEKALLGRAYKALKSEDQPGFERAMSAFVDIKLMELMEK